MLSSPPCGWGCVLTSPWRTPPSLRTCCGSPATEQVWTLKAGRLPPCPCGTRDHSGARPQPWGPGAARRCGPGSHMPPAAPAPWPGGAGVTDGPGLPLTKVPRAPAGGQVPCWTLSAPCLTDEDAEAQRGDVPQVTQCEIGAGTQNRVHCFPGPGRSGASQAGGHLWTWGLCIRRFSGTEYPCVPLPLTG